MILRGLLAAALVLGLSAAADAALSVSSPAFAENTALPVSGSQPNCGGGSSLSPPLAWTGAPATTQSFALVLYDPDAGSGPGFVHWVTYGIPASVTSIPAGYGANNAGHVGGANGAGSPLFLGYCPPAGDVPHHYSFTVYATDLAPDALSAGLTRDALLAALKGHVKGVMTLVGRYGR